MFDECTELSFGNALMVDDDPFQTFWTCPTTENDCRHEDKPALAIIRGPDRTCTFQMYSTWALADEVSSANIECQKGMTADFILDNLLYHTKKKSWIDHKAFCDAMRRIAERFGDKYWYGDCANSQNPLMNARPRGAK